LSRTHYEQFTITAASGYSVRVDSFTLNSAFYNTASSTKLAIVYSKTGFTTADSTDVTGGILGSTGASLAVGQTGGFATPILLTNQTSATTVNYRLALNSSTGVTIAAGQTLTMRIYFCCSSTGIPRDAMVKDVFLKGLTNVVLPLSILDIKAEKINNSANRLKWTTANEKNVSHFEIERSSDGLEFNNIGTTKAMGHTSSQDYTFIDAHPLSIFNYYRLKMMDVDGSFTYTKVVSVDNSTGQNNKITVYPNPFTDVLTLAFENSNAPKTALVIELSDALGRSVWLQNLTTGTQAIDIQTASLPSGTYFLSIKEGLNTTIYKVIK
jgi:hypothetical protein